MKRVLGGISLLLVSLIYLAPVLFMFIGSLKPDADVLVQAGSWRALWPDTASLENYRNVIARVPFGRYLFNSLFITVAIVAGGLLVNSLAGYAFSRLQFRGRNLLFAVVLALMIIPLEAIAVPLFYQVTLFGWRDTYIVQIIPFIANAFSIYLFYTYFLGLPKELEESARIDGAGVLRTFFLIIAPNALPRCHTDFPYPVGCLSLAAHGDQRRRGPASAAGNRHFSQPAAASVGRHLCLRGHDGRTGYPGIHCVSTLVRTRCRGHGHQGLNCVWR